jgi:hypothetical protein
MFQFLCRLIFGRINYEKLNQKTNKKLNQKIKIIKKLTKN